MLNRTLTGDLFELTLRSFLATPKSSKVSCLALVCLGSAWKLCSDTMWGWWGLGLRLRLRAFEWAYSARITCIWCLCLILLTVFSRLDSLRYLTLLLTGKVTAISSLMCTGWCRSMLVCLRCDTPNSPSVRLSLSVSWWLSTYRSLSWES